MPCFIYLNGYPGIGKLTIAKELEKLLPNSRLYHSHLLIDSVDAMVDRTCPGYHGMRTGLRRYLLNEIAISQYTKKHNVDLYRCRGVPFISIVLEREMEENIRRAVNVVRGQTVSAKLTDEKILREVLQNENIYRFEKENELVLDVTNLSAKEAALRIKKHANRFTTGHGSVAWLLNIELTTHSLDEAKALNYHALSYTWGPPVGDDRYIKWDLSPVLVNGEKFYVQPNLFHALVRFEGYDWYLWIDAICIDQSNQKEREIQVGIMSEIYSMAARVDIWLGQAGKDSAEAIPMTQKLARLAEETRGKEVSNAHLEKTGLPPIPSVAWKPFVALMERNWFRRAWVVQETVLARQTVLFLGNNESISWEELTSAYALIIRLGWFPNGVMATVKVEEVSWPPGPNAIHFITMIKMTLESLKEPKDHPFLSVMGELTGTDNWKTTASSHLAYMMMVCHKFKVTDDRDRVYSLLGMVNIAANYLGIPRCAVEVDYDATTAQVFTAATANILHHCNHLGFISLAGIAEFHHGTQNMLLPGLPSWVPNFSTEVSAARTIPILFHRNNMKDLLDASRYSEIDSLGFTITGSRLSVQAHCVGQILPGSYQFYDLALYFYIESFAYLLLRCGQYYKPTGELSLEACWRTFIFGSDIPDSTIDSSKLGGCFKAWLSWILLRGLKVWDYSMTVNERLSNFEKMTNYRYLVSRDGDEARPSDPPDLQLLSVLAYMGTTYSVQGFTSPPKSGWTSTVAKELVDTFDQAAQYARLLGSYVGQRRIFLTDQGFLGWAFSSALEGDSVWVVSSCPVPLVLRPRADGTYQLVGDSYVHGIMKGEAVKDNTWEEITIT
ncbi:heterokaryon incompatibility (het-6OR allele) [Fusarium beomiforme]|uniref:Heterokaryon incompatibility (Het-6OR allele) n=1 Tax=Fusarium beomiforme TaxID=44412 RepID=A0A9P5A4D2_9HYPO|nr:heterokaryon incompatibility (het-6OR allele) [Fusarium beomiforme]